ncbi:MAG: beta-galactosidase, partial [bacterium]|nr:beta-galactosidase [bacterium]
KGVLSHDLEENRAYREVTQIAAELQRVGPRLANFERKSDVAILYSADSFHGIRFMPFDDHVNYISALNQLYGALYRLNVGVDFVFPESASFDGYKVIVVPPLYIASEQLLGRLAKFVQDGGHLVVTPKSGFTNEHSTVRWEKAPGPLRKAAGFYYQEFSSLTRPLALKDDPYGAGEDNRVQAWAEMLIPESAETLATYDHPFFGDYPAITRNKHGKGTLTYEGTFLSDTLQQSVLRQVIELAGLTGSNQKLPPTIHVKEGTSNRGRPMRYYLNYSAQPQTLTYTHDGGKELLTGKRIGPADTITLGPWDLAVIEETE